ncbi:tryptophan halogenase [Cellvibrio zantedeschiae]|uniref:Tryptophan halogenase n=2 Tax=Cellvibrio zantedeschiae TaxID=1237077 RepID=A0ABQ3B768_9GAMM|nr:tryptophan halogenase [Cellvibrio zantedeschiae]
MLQLSFASSENEVEVQLIELPAHLRQQDFFNVLPSHKTLHTILGANENALMRSSSGLYCVAQRFSNWSGAAAPFMHAYDTQGVDLAGVDFLQYWIKARSKGLNVPLEEFSLGAVAAKQGRFILLDDDARTFSKASHGFTFNAISYLRAAGAAALKSGLKHQVGTIKSVDVNDGRIQSITLQDDSRVEADLFIDASGSEALLISKLEKDNYESWSHWLPCDRIMVASAPRLDPVPAFCQISAFKEGWLGLFPLLDRTAVTAAYSSQYASGQEVLQKISAISGMKLSDAVESPFSAGGRKKHWIGNCIALGSAAANLEPLDATQLHVLHLGLSQLRAFFPVDAEDMLEADAFNEKMNSNIINVRDFQIAHYKLNKRFDEPFWDKARHAEVPETLENKIKLFERRGLVAMREDETFQEENWTSLFIGHGLIPKSYDPLVEQAPEAEQIEQFQRILKFISAEVEKMPSLQAHVEMNM